MASPVHSAFTSSKNLHPTLSILVSSPMTEPNYYTRGLNGDSYYDDYYSNTHPPPPPTGPHPNIAGFNNLKLDTEICDVDVNYKSDSHTPKAPITNERRLSEEDNCVDQFDNDDTISESLLLDDNGLNDTNSTLSSGSLEKQHSIKASELRGFGTVGIQVQPETDVKSSSPIRFEGVEYISSTTPVDCSDKETETEDFRVDIVMRNMDISKEEAKEFINSDENEENLCPLIERRERVDSLDSVSPDEYNCDKTTSPLEERERIIEEYEDKLNDLTLEIYEKQTRLEDLERSLTRRQARLEVKEKNLANSGFDNVFHLSVVILVGYTATKIVALFFN